jgi:hypothetical protein
MKPGRMTTENDFGSISTNHDLCTIVDMGVIRPILNP